MTWSAHILEYHPLVKIPFEEHQEPIALQSGAKERPTAENSDVLNRNFDLS